MKKLVFLMSLVCLFALNSFAQTPNFAGEWSLDKAKSTMSQQQKDFIESQIMKVEQTEKEIKSSIETKRVEGAGGPGGGPGGNRPGGGMGGPVVYTLGGSEVVTERETPNGKVTIKTTAKIEGGKLEIVNKSVGPDGTERTGKTTWALSADGKTLTVKQTRQTPNGEMTVESVYTKKS